MENILNIINIITIAVVGVILFNLNKSQKSIIQNYKDYISSIDPNKALSLKDVEMEQIKKIYSNDIELLQKQVHELRNYTNYILNHFESVAEDLGEPSEFNKETVINNNMPNCRSLFD